MDAHIKKVIELLGRLPSRVQNVQVTQEMNGMTRMRVSVDIFMGGYSPTLKEPPEQKQKPKPKRERKPKRKFMLSEEGENP